MHAKPTHKHSSHASWNQHFNYSRQQQLQLSQGHDSSHLTLPLLLPAPHPARAAPHARVAAVLLPMPP